MELFKRIKEISKHFTSSDKALAERLGFKQATFSGYLNEKRQDNLWPILPSILELFPSLSRDWLYFGEGSMFKDRTTSEEPPCLAPSAPDPVPAEDTRVQELERENAELNVELRGALKEIRRLNEEKRELEERLKCTPELQDNRLDNPQHATSDRPASGATDCGV